MNEIEKVKFAIMLAEDLLGADKKILALRLIKALYQTNLHEAKLFVDKIEALLNKTC